MDPATQYLVGSGLQLGGQVASAGGGLITGHFNRKHQRDVNKKNEALMRESWGREDTAVQRRTQDLRAAGINPLLAAGQAAQSGAPIKLDPLESSDISGQLAGMGEAGKNMAMSKLQGAQAAIGIAQGQEEIKKTKSEIGLIDAQMRAAEANTTTTDTMRPLEVARRELELGFDELANPIKLESLVTSLEGITLNNARTTVQNELSQLEKTARNIGIDQARFNLAVDRAEEVVNAELRQHKVPEKLQEILNLKLIPYLVAAQMEELSERAKLHGRNPVTTNTISGSRSTPLGGNTSGSISQSSSREGNNLATWALNGIMNLFK